MLAMLAVLPEMERDLPRAKAEGKTLGRPSKTTSEQRKAMTQGTRAIRAGAP